MTGSLAAVRRYAESIPVKYDLTVLVIAAVIPASFSSLVGGDYPKGHFIYQEDFVKAKANGAIESGLGFS